jgi:UDP-N-acetylmuramate dehydrogenase
MEAAVNVPLWRYTTLKIGGEAGKFCQPTSVDQLVELTAALTAKKEPWFILGGGSNLLVSSNGYKGTVIRTVDLKSMTNPESVIVEADAGARLPHLARYAASLGLSGLEFLVGVPGTVGGAVIMNAGAHNSCVADVLDEVTVYDSVKNDIVKIKNADLDFSYRRCCLNSAKHVVLSARFKLNLDDREVIERNTKHNEEYRWKTQPLGWPNAGSTFKNPEPARSAGLLLDQAGAKTLKEGQAAVSAVHANFVINMGGATSSEVATLVKRMQDCVFTSFSVQMHPEWRTLGDFSDSEHEPWLS